MVSSVGSIYHLVLPNCSRSSSVCSHQRALQCEISTGKTQSFFLHLYVDVLYHLKICLSTEICPSFKAHIKENEEVLATDRYGRCNEHVDPETWEQKPWTRHCSDEQAGGRGSESKSNRQTGHAICRAEIYR